MSDYSNSAKPEAIKLIAIINGIAAILHLSFWILAFIKLDSIASQNSMAERLNLATTYGFGIADILWSVPFLLLGSVGVWKIKFSGWMAAQFANALYWYSFTVILFREFTKNSFAPGTLLFLPFALFSFWAAFYLWKKRHLFTA